MPRETEYDKFEQDLLALIERTKAAEKERDELRELVKKCAEALDAPEWPSIWSLLNAFASGKTQRQFARVEPITVLAETYQGCAIIHERAQQLVKELRERGYVEVPKQEES